MLRDLSRTGRTISLLVVLAISAALAHPVIAAAPAAKAEPVVAIVKGEDVDKMVAEAISLIGGIKGLVKDGDTVVIKPNLVTPAKAQRPGLMTDVRIVAAIIREVKAVAKCKIIVAEGSAPDIRGGCTLAATPDAFKGNGYTEMAEKLGVELVDLNADKRVSVKVAGLARQEYDMPETIMKADVLVDVPVLKTHNIAGVTLGIKNLFGLMSPPKERFHGSLNEVLCDIVKMRRPDLVVVDGLVGTEGQGPLDGTAIKVDVILAGRDIVATDAVAAAVMGFDARRVPAIVLSNKAGLGEIDLAKIIVKGKQISDVKKPFKPATMYARITMLRDDAMIKKLVSLADSVEEVQHSWGGSEKRAIFKPDRLKPDAAKYPLRASYGFSVGLDGWSDAVEFRAPYEVIIEENGQAAIEEMYRWIETNLGIKDKGVARARVMGD